MTGLTVIKIGGSLLHLKNIEHRVAEWCKKVDVEDFLIVLGGGWLADGVRQWGECHGSSDEKLHFLAMECMSINTAVSSQIFPLPIFRSAAEWQSESRRPRRGYWECGRWSHSHLQLPRNWDTTSDSIAAAVAIELQAEQLILLKSRLPSPDETGARWMSSGLVDNYFRVLAPALNRVRVVRVDRTGFSEVPKNLG